MAGLGQTQRQTLQNLLFRNTGTSPAAATLYVALYTTDPGVDGASGTEVSGGSYARKSVVAADWNAPTAANPSVVSNVNAITFVTATGNWGTVTHFGIWRVSSSGTAADYLGGSSLTASQVVNTGNTASFAGGSPGALVHNLSSV